MKQGRRSSFLVLGLLLPVFFSSISQAKSEADLAIERMADHVAYFSAYLDAGKPYPVAEELFWQIEIDASLVRDHLHNQSSNESDWSGLESQYVTLQDIVRDVFERELADIRNDEETRQTTENRDTINTRQAQLKGTIRDLNGHPVSGAVTKLYTQWGDLLETHTSGSNGIFHFNNLSSSSYLLVVTAVGYADEGYPNIPCHNGLAAGCEVVDLQTIELGINESITDLDFQLDFAPTISGTVATSPPGYTVVILYDDQANILAQQSAGDDGSYTFEVEAQSTYKILAYSYLSQSIMMYEDVVCYGLCDLTQASDIPVANNNVVLNHMQIPASQWMGGVVIDQGTGLPTNQVNFIDFIDADSGELRTYIRGQYLNEDGLWSTYLRPGNYHVRVLSDDYQVHYAVDQNCGGSEIEHCDFNTLTPTTFAHDNISNIPDVQLNLVRAGSISGQLISPGNNRDLRYDAVVLYNAAGEVVDSTGNNQGFYSFTGLPDGTYYVATSHRYQPTAYPDFRCALNRNNDYTCLDITQSSPVVVNQQEQVTGIDILIQSQPHISGTIVDDNNIPVSNVLVQVYEYYNGELTVKANRITNSSGQYQFNGLYNGDFYISAEIFNGNEIYIPFYKSWFPDVVCDDEDSACPVNQAVPVVITDHNNAEGMDIELTRRGRLDFTLNAYGLVKLYDSNGQYVTTYGVNTNKQVYINHGQYHMVFTDNEQDYDPFAMFISHVKGYGNCYADCDPTLGTLFNIQPQSITPVDFVINRAHRVNMSLGGSEHRGAQILLYANDELLATGSYSYPNDIFLNTQETVKMAAVKEGFKPSFHDNVVCDDLACGLPAATEIVPTPGDSSSAFFSMLPHNGVSGRIQTADGTNVSMYVDLIPVVPGGNTYRSVSTPADGMFEFEALEEGDYYVYAYHGQNPQDPVYSNVLYGAGLCTEKALCDFSSAQVIQVRDGQFIGNIDIEVFPLGSLYIQNTRYNNGLMVYDATQFWLFEWRDGQYEYVKEDSTFQSQTEVELEHLYQQNYRLMAVQKLDNYYIKTVYPNVSCTGLDQQTCLSMGADIPISWGQETLINDLVLTTPPALMVQVTDADNGAYVPNYIVRLYNPENGYRLFNYFIGGSESDQFLPVSPESSYIMEIKTYDNESHDSQLYDGVNCPLGVGIDCDISDGTVIGVNEGGLLNIQVALQRRPELSIRVVDEVTRLPISASIKLYDQNEQLFNTYDSQSGVFDLNVLAGDYFVVADANTHDPSAYPDSTCSSFNLFGCDNTPLPVNVTASMNPNPELDLNLANGVQGFVIEAATGLPVPGVAIDLWTMSSIWLDTTTTAANGGFSVYSNEFRVRVSTHLPRPSYLYDEVYDNIQCYEGSAFDGLCELHTGADLRTSFAPTILFELETDLIHANGFDTLPTDPVDDLLFD